MEHPCLAPTLHWKGSVRSSALLTCALKHALVYHVMFAVIHNPQTCSTVFFNPGTLNKSIQKEDCIHS